jgi:hypothetical protein
MGWHHCWAAGPIGLGFPWVYIYVTNLYGIQVLHFSYKKGAKIILWLVQIALLIEAKILLVAIAEQLAIAHYGSYSGTITGYLKP